MNKFILFITLTSSLHLFSFISNAQTLTQIVKGRVVDQQSKSPIIGATVQIENSNPILGSSTDVDGYFKIANVPIGRQVILSSSIGYESKSIPNISVTSGKEVFIEIELMESLVQMDEVLVLASKENKGKPENEMATVSAISLSVEETKRYAATFGDPARAVLSQPGVSSGGDDVLNEIVIRGNSPKGILWRLEGVEIPNPNHFAAVGSSAGGISMLSSSVLSNSDFFTAAFPAQYGNATSGIFDLKMRKGNFDTYEHSFQAGLLGIAVASEGPLSKKSNASYLFNYRYSTLALLNKVGLNILDDEEEVLFQDLSFKIHLPTKKLGSFSIWGLGGSNSYESKYTYSFDFTDNLAYSEYYFSNFEYREDSTTTWTESDISRQKMGAAGVSHIAYLNKNTYLESVLAVTGSQSLLTYDSLGVKIYDNENIKEHQVRLSSFLNHKFDAKNTLRVGVIATQMNFDLKNEYWNSAISDYTVELDQGGRTHFLQGFAQWQVRVNQDLTLNSGFHASHFVLNNKTYFEPRVGFKWNADSRNVFTGGAGLHSRMETLSLYMAQNNFNEQPNRDLAFTKAAHSVIGYQRTITNNLRFKTEAYYQYLYNVPVWSNEERYDFENSFSAINSYDGYTSIPLQNVGTGENYGLEMTLEKFFSNQYFFMVNGSVYESKYKGVDGIKLNTIFNGNYIFNALGGKEFSFSNGRNLLNINARFIYAGGKREAPILINESRANGETVRDYSRNFEVKLDDYWRIDFGISYQKNMNRSASVISFNVQNLLARENESGRFYSPASQSVVSSTQLGFFPNISYRIEF